MNHKFIRVAAYSILALMVLVTLVFAYWTFEPSKVIEVKNQPVPVRPDTINPEATIIVSPTICKYLNKPAQVSRYLVSASAKVQLPDYGNKLPTGCRTYDLPVIIPGNTPDGSYHLEYSVVYTINPITTTTVKWYTQNFIVKHVPPLPISVVDPTQPSVRSQSTAPTTSTNTPAASTPTPAPSTSTKKPLIQKVKELVNSILN